MISFRRRRFLISRLQVNILLNLVVYGFAIIMGIGTLVFLPSALELHNPDLSIAERAKASSIFLAMDVRIWPAVSVICLVIGAHAVLLTHRIVGPLYRFQMVIQAVLGGELSMRARIRKRDMLHAEADQLNELLEQHERGLLGIGKELGQVRECLEKGLSGVQDEREASTFREALQLLASMDARHGASASDAPAPQDSDSVQEVPAALPTEPDQPDSVDAEGKAR